MTSPPDFEALAQIFAGAYADTGNIADALRVYESVRARCTVDIQAVRLNDIVAAVGRYFNIPPKTILGPSTVRSVSVARQMCWHIVRARNLSLNAIGAAFGRDHSTVILGLRKFEQRLAADATLRAATTWMLAEFQRPQPQKVAA